MRANFLSQFHHCPNPKIRMNSLQNLNSTTFFRNWLKTKIKYKHKQRKKNKKKKINEFSILSTSHHHFSTLFSPES